MVDAVTAKMLDASHYYYVDCGTNTAVTNARKHMRSV